MSRKARPRPYLEGPIEVDETDTTLQWAEYLGKTFGTAGALATLRYYQELGWISPRVRGEVEQYLEGLSLQEIHSKKYDEPGVPTGPLTPLSGTPFGAHAKSLEFISTIADDGLRRDMLRAKLAKEQAGVELTRHDETADDRGDSMQHEA
jgi:archaellum component FlaD/FlaE